MFELHRGRLALKYIFLEIVPGFFLGIAVFLFILLMFQALRLTEFILVHGISLKTTGQIMGYLGISFLPIVFPMSLLFSVLITYGRLSADSEIMALRSLGLTMTHLMIPAFIFGVLMMLASMQISFYLAPWGNRQFESLITDFGRLKATVAIKEGVFSEDFFNLVVYANHVDTKKNLLQKVFIYDEREANAPLTIIAKEGYLLRTSDPKTGDHAHLKLINGSIHRTHLEKYTKIDFTSYEISLFDPVNSSARETALQSMSIDDVRESLKRTGLNQETRIKHQIEVHRRWALSIACLIFACLGVGLGTATNLRLARGSGMVLCLLVIVSYWILYMTSEGMANNKVLPVAPALWIANTLFGFLAIWSLRRANATK
ncbi:MAG: LptF/LptG family permease [Bdellovibrionales bacterium]|nr:LptF/LptG family permease [Bdellovibrionales bacterium]